MGLHVAPEGNRHPEMASGRSPSKTRLLNYSWLRHGLMVLTRTRIQHHALGGWKASRSCKICPFANLLKPSACHLKLHVAISQLCHHRLLNMVLHRSAQEHLER